MTRTSSKLQDGDCFSDDARPLKARESRNITSPSSRERSNPPVMSAGLVRRRGLLRSAAHRRRGRGGTRAMLFNTVGNLRPWTPRRLRTCPRATSWWSPSSGSRLATSGAVAAAVFHHHLKGEGDGRPARYLALRDPLPPASVDFPSDRRDHPATTGPAASWTPSPSPKTPSKPSTSIFRTR